MEPATTPVRGWALLALAILITGVNALKPCHYDDLAYLAYAREFAAHPASPYGFQFANPPFLCAANALLVPPVLPYWLSLAVRLGGDDPVWLRCWLLPFVGLFLGSGYLLARRLGCPYPLLLMSALILSPGVLPGINCMLDVPALGLLLTAVLLQWRAGERGSWSLAIVSGLVAGLAMQTKYTTFLVVPLLASMGLVHGRWLMGLLAGVLAVSVFVGWECYLQVTQGASHFLVGVQMRSGSALRRMAYLLVPTLSLIGPVGAGFASLILLTLNRLRWALVPLGLALVTVPVLALVPEAWQAWVPGKQAGHVSFGLAHVMHGATGVAVLAAIALAVVQLLRAEGRTLDRFLVLWLVLEAGAMLALTPYPAARRLMGLVVVLALIAGRLAALAPKLGMRPEYRWAAVATILLGLVYQSVDWGEALANRVSAQAMTRRATDLADGGAVWSFGWHGFEYHAERAGTRPFCWQGEHPRPGDVFLVLENEVMRDPLRFFPTAGVEPAGAEPVPSFGPLTLGSGYYAGRLPLSRWRGPPQRAVLYRVTGPLGQP